MIDGGVGGFGGEAGDEGGGGFVLDVEEDDVRVLESEGFDEGCSDAGGSAGDEDGAGVEGGVGGVLGHGMAQVEPFKLYFGKGITLTDFTRGLH